jgi:signal transduction histidine kinase
LNPVISHFTKDEGLPDDSYNYVYNIKGTMYIASKKGIFKIIYPKTISADSSQFRFIEDSQLNSVFNGNPMEIMEINLDSTNNIWIHSNDFIGKIQFSQEKKLNWFTTPFQKIKSNIYRAYFEDSGIVWISTYDGLFQYNSNNCKNYYQDYMSLIRKVIINNHERYSGYSHLKTDSLNNPKSIEKTLSDVKSNAEIRKTPEFSSHENSIEFRFSTPFYEHADENQYSYFLAGNDQQWSQWSSDAKVTYTNLSLGTYCFQVKARNVFLQQSLPGMYHFIINPHWSKSLWAIISYIVLSLLVFTAVVFLILRLRTNTLKRNKEKLTQVVEQRTIDLKNSINELTLANEYKGELLNIMAHGLKNPLQIIRGHADLLEMKLKSNNFQDPAKLFKHINTMQSSSEQMLTLIQNTLSNAANSKKLQVMNLSLMNLSELAQFVSDAFRQIAINKQQELIINIKNNIFINGDKSRIREIIENLISNATKYTPLSGRIGFSVKPVNGFAEMSVQDNGPGISEEDKTNLFKEFHRLSSTPTGGESSTGLGLSIVKKLVELHQGIIQVESTLGKGSKFIVRIPLANEQINHLQLIADINTVAGQNNYESFQQHITNEWYRCLRNQKPLSLILMKIVPFKKIIKDHNIDRIYQCQIAINKIFSREINRAGDYFCQYKDELFLILLTETDQRGAQEAIESFETSFQQSNCIRDLQIDSETKGIQTVFTTIIPSLGKRVDDLINELLARMNKIKK